MTGVLTTSKHMVISTVKNRINQQKKQRELKPSVFFLYIAYYFQTSSDISFMSLSFANCWSKVSLLPSPVEANPHFGGCLFSSGLISVTDTG